MKFETITNKEEILKAIKKADKKGTHLIWQSPENKERVLIEFSAVELDPIREIIRIEVPDLSAFNFALPIYAKLSKRNTIFKGMILRKDNNQLYIGVPDEIQMEELRTQKRFKFFVDERRQAMVHINSPVMANSHTKLPVSLLDVSQSGMGALLDPKVKPFLIGSSEDVFLSSLGLVDLPDKPQIEIVHEKEFPWVNEEGVTEPLHKIGIKFSHGLPENVLQDYIRLQESLNKDELGILKFTNKFKKKFHHQYSKLQKHLLSRKSFTETFGGVLNKNLGDTYIARHVRTLAMTSCAIARLVGVNDTLTLSQLIYLSFVHDVALFKNPKIAQIKGQEHFMRVKDMLTFEEKELFLSASKIAHEFSVQDKNAPLGVEFLVEEFMHYRMSAAPQVMLKNRELSYHLSIFIMAHDLADYMYARPQWTFYEYLEQFQFLEYGGVFEKVYDALSLKRRISA